MSRRIGQSEGLIFLLLIVIGTLVFGDVLFLGRQLYLRDLTRFYFPTMRVVREILLNGEFPFWNPYYQAGQPLAANPEYAVFYPFQWLVLLPSFQIGYDLHIIVHVWLGLIGMYLLLRSIELEVPASVFGALSFGIGGLFLSQINLLPILFCATWMPWILWRVRIALLRPSIRAISLASLLVGIQLLCAEPTTLVQTWFLIGCYVIYRAWHSEGRIAMFLWGSFLSAIILVAGSAAGAAQLFPAIGHVHDSVRSRPFDFGLVTTWSMPFAKPLELIYPNLFGHLSRANVMWYWGSGMYPNVGSPFIFNYYVGLLVISLAAGAIMARPKGGRLTLFLVSISALLALGGNTPLFKYLHLWGLAKSVRYPEKFAFMGVFALIIFSAVMFDRLLRGDERLRNGVTGFVLGTTVFALILSVFSFTPWYATLFGKLWGESGANLTFMVGMTRADWIVATLRGATLFGILWWLKKRGPEPAWLALTLAFILFDLVPIGYEINPRLPHNFFTQPPVARTLAADRKSYRIFHEADWYGGDEQAKKYLGTGASVYWVVRNGLFPQTTASWGFRTSLERDYDKTALLPTVDLVEEMWKVRDAPQNNWREIFMAMSGARYYTQYRPFDDEKKRTGGDFDKSEPMNFIDVGPNPDVYFAGDVVRVKDKNEFSRNLISKDWNRQVAFVTDMASFTPSPGRVLHLDERANQIDVDVDSSGRALLVFSITTHKYWRATIDGRPAPIHVANIAYQAVEVPRGRHRVHLQYSSDVVVRSVALSVTAILMLAGAAIFVRPDPIDEEPAERESAGDPADLAAPVDEIEDEDEVGAYYLEE